MKKSVKLIIAVVVVFFMLSFGISAQSFTPGDEQDPLVTLGYMNLKIDELKVYIDEKIGAADSTETPIGNQTTNVAISVPETYKVIEVKMGQTLTGKEGTSIILRSGEAKVVTLGVDGMVDLTDGIDVKNDMDVKKNHQLLVPRDDGRSIYAKTDLWIMVKGNYILK